MADGSGSLVPLLLFYALPLLVILLAIVALDGNVFVILFAGVWLGLGVVFAGAGEPTK